MGGCPTGTDRLPLPAFWQVQAVGGHVFEQIFGTGHLCSGRLHGKDGRDHTIGGWGAPLNLVGGKQTHLAGAGQQHPQEACQGPESPE